MVTNSSWEICFYLLLKCLSSKESSFEIRVFGFKKKVCDCPSLGLSIQKVNSTTETHIHVNKVSFTFFWKDSNHRFASLLSCLPVELYKEESASRTRAVVSVDIEIVFKFEEGKKKKKKKLLVPVRAKVGDSFGTIVTLNSNDENQTGKQLKIRLSL